MNIHSARVWGAVTAAVACAVDQLSKWCLLEVVAIGSRPPIEITPFFNLVMVWNRGISFGMFPTDRLSWVLSALALVIIVILGRWLSHVTHVRTALALGMIIGGAFGNVIDRVRFGAVADFFDVHAFSYHWPAFNVADSCIFIGVVVLCVESIIEGGKKTS